MCGICGIYHRRSQPVSNGAQRLRAMIQRLHHRGPDGSGQYIRKQIALGHTRLKIIDLDGGKQPLANEDETVWVTFNGEIFNYIELRKELIALGHRFRTQSDTEVLVHAYETYGDEFVTRLNGQFAFAIWDGRRKRLLLGRDRAGIAPLYYQITNDEIRFASEIKALNVISETRPSLDMQALVEIATFWATLGPHTVFRGVQELLPGHLLVVDGENVRTHQYWSWTFPPQEELSQGALPEIASRFEELLTSATALRLRADVSVGGYLSGGIDSSSVMSILSRSQEGADAYSLEFEQADLDESRYQRLVAEALGVNRHAVRVDASSVTAHLEDTLWHTETPLVRTGPVPMGQLSALVNRLGNKVVLTGEGADEVLGGYDIFKEAKIRAFLARDPNSSLRPQLLKRLYPYLDIADSQATAMLRGFFASEPTAGSGERYLSHQTRWRNSGWASRFIHPEALEPLCTRPEDLVDRICPPEFDRWHTFCQAQWLEARILLNGYILSSQGDRMLLSHGVEGRFPFLDHRLIEFLNGLHPVYKMPGISEKMLLKRVLSKALPRRILRRPKQPYRASSGSTKGNYGLAQLVEERLNHKELDRAGYFDPAMVRRLLDKTARQDTLSFREESAINLMLTTQIWHQQFVEGWRSPDFAA